MKLAVILTGLLLIIGAANSVPVTAGEVATGADEMPMGAEEIPEEFQEDTHNDTGINADEEGGQPSDQFLEEVREYFQQHPISDSSLSREERQAYGGVINHGDTIALQTWARSKWLSCAVSQFCETQTCPLLYMMGNDWTACSGEVFRIYRTLGPGVVRVGDLVGLYYPRERGRWFGCYGINCGKATCPGYPTTAHGFATAEDWYRCWAEVFVIYASGKGSGAIINAQDEIVLYYLQEGLWVGQGYEGYTRKYPGCLGPSRPPPLARYDGCVLENFKIWKRD